MQDTREFTHNALKEKLSTTDEEMTASYLKALLKELEKEGQLRKAIMTLFEGISLFGNVTYN
jgi:hypothetical protein